MGPYHGRRPLCARFLMLLVVLPAVLEATQVFGQQRTGSTTLVLSIASAARVELPTSIKFREGAELNAGGRLSGDASLQITVRPDGSTTRAALLANWEPSADLTREPCPELSASDSLLRSTGSTGNRFSALFFPHPLRMGIRARWNWETAGLVRLASLSQPVVPASPPRVLAREPGPAEGAWLIETGKLAPGQAASLAAFPGVPIRDAGISLQFEVPATLFRLGRQGVLTFTLAVF